MGPADALATVREVTDGEQDVVQAYQTDEFGVPTQSYGSSGQAFGYTGEQRDPESGLDSLGGRTYDPATGRLLSRDTSPGSIWKPFSLDRYIQLPLPGIPHG